MIFSYVHVSVVTVRWVVRTRAIAFYIDSNCIVYVCVHVYFTLPNYFSCSQWVIKTSR